MLGKSFYVQNVFLTCPSLFDEEVSLYVDWLFLLMSLDIAIVLSDDDATYCLDPLPFFFQIGLLSRYKPPFILVIGNQGVLAA